MLLTLDYTKVLRVVAVEVVGYFIMAFHDLLGFALLLRGVKPRYIFQVKLRAFLIVAFFVLSKILSFALGLANLR